MYNLRNWYLIQPAIQFSLVFVSFVPSSVLAQLPTFAEPDVSATPESQIVPVPIPQVSPITIPDTVPVTLPQVSPTNIPDSTPTNTSQILPNTAPEFVRPPYILGPGDQIQITVFDYEEFTGPQVILPDGTITLPIIGVVKAAGRSTDTLARELTERLQKILVEPVVSISLTVLRPISISVTGEVNRPGPILLRSITTNPVSNTFINGGSLSLEGVSTVSSALLEAGGITQNADLRQIIVRRSLPNGNSIATIINLWEALRSGNTFQNLTLQDGDSIYVPELSADEAINRRLIASSSLAPKTVRVRVVGEVTKPGQLDIPPTSSISSAIASAGGPTDDAKLAQVTLIRFNEQGTVSTQELDLRSFNDNSQIQEGDVIIVPKSNASSILDFAERLADPWDFLLSIIRLFQ